MNIVESGVKLHKFIYLLHSFYIAHYLILKLLKALYIKAQITKKQKAIYRIKLFTDKCETLCTYEFGKRKSYD